ncbi:MAG: hypothetical protein ROZ37_19080, partial [Aromatoleum sp.]|uniref:hypothetical protein n=1 Tax=Aromatoleum sp. TaxID=2307007 RepID=UPI00289433E9
PIAVAQSAEKAAGIVIRAAQVGSFQHRFFSRRPETEGEGGIFNTLLGGRTAVPALRLLPRQLNTVRAELVEALPTPFDKLRANGCINLPG